MMQTLGRGVALALLLVAWRPSAAAAQEREMGQPWATDSALTIPAGRVEIGLFHASRWAPTDRLELGVHPLLFFALPHVEAKVRLLHRGGLHFAGRGRLSYPTLFLELVSREGSGGLLPPDRDPRVAIGLDVEGLASWAVSDAHLLTLEVGMRTAPRLSSGDDPLLDFPFLYSRFAALHTVATVHVGLGAEGWIFDWLAYSVDIDLHLLPVVEGGYTVEQGGSLHWRPSDRFSLALGYRIEQGRFPAGSQLHFLPFADVTVASP